MPGMYSADGTAEEGAVVGPALAVAESSASSFRLKYAMISHRYTFPIEQVFVENVQQVAAILENTDTISNVHSLKELLARKGLNLRFEWLLLTKLKSATQRELCMVHILLRIIKKVVNEELKLKA